jgi:hypothetical protein
MNGGIRTCSVLDIIIIVCMVSAACAFMPLLQSHRPAVVVVFRDNIAVSRYPLSSPKVFSVRGKDGDLTLSIKNNCVRVIAAQCPKRICMQTGAIGRNGQQIVCVPNHILIELETSSENGIDGVTQ